MARSVAKAMHHLTRVWSRYPGSGSFTLKSSSPGVIVRRPRKPRHLIGALHPDDISFITSHAFDLGDKRWRAYIKDRGLAEPTLALSHTTPVAWEAFRILLADLNGVDPTRVASRSQPLIRPVPVPYRWVGRAGHLRQGGSRVPIVWLLPHLPGPTTDDARIHLTRGKRARKATRFAELNHAKARHLVGKPGAWRRLRDDADRALLTQLRGLGAGEWEASEVLRLYAWPYPTRNLAHHNLRSLRHDPTLASLPFELDALVTNQRLPSQKPTLRLLGALATERTDRVYLSVGWNRWGPALETYLHHHLGDEATEVMDHFTHRLYCYRGIEPHQPKLDAALLPYRGERPLGEALRAIRASSQQR